MRINKWVVLLLAYFTTFYGMSQTIVSTNSKEKSEVKFIILDSVTKEIVIGAQLFTSTGKKAEISVNDFKGQVSFVLPCDSSVMIQISALGYRDLMTELHVPCVGIDTVEMIYYIKQILKDNMIYDIFPDSLNPATHRRMPNKK